MTTCPFFQGHVHTVMWFSKKYDIKMSCNDLGTNGPRTITHLLISIALTSTFQTSLANFGMSKTVSTVTNKLHVGFGGNREDLKEKHTEKNVQNR